MSINSVCISGNLGRDPELRATASGTQVCSFSVCVNDRRQNQQGEWEDVPNWVDVTFFGKRAESIERYLFKGSLVFVKGRLHQNKWQDKNGNNRSKLEVIGEDIHFGGGNQSQQGQQRQQQGYQPPQGYQYAPPSPQQQPVGYQPDYGYQEQMPMDGGVYDDDIPF